ncbi:MAG: hypothetical protein ACLGIP_18145 [Alphaproteobacteria bacterium]
MMLLGASLLLAGCVQSGEGCATYGMQRASMPPLGMDGLSEWVATTDTAMTRACRG